MSTATYWPESLVGITLETPVSLLVSVTFASATAAPDGSVTVPTMVASCAKAGVASAARKSKDKTITAKHTRLRLVILRPHPPAFVGERDIICSLQIRRSVGTVLWDRTTRVRERLRCILPVVNLCQEENRYRSAIFAFRNGTGRLRAFQSVS